MAYTHTIELAYNSSELEGELDLTDVGNVSIKIPEGIEMHLDDLRELMDLIISVVNICAHCGDIDHLEISKI